MIILSVLAPAAGAHPIPTLGIYVNYSDIYNAKALVEITGKGRGAVPEPSLGTHFFQDLLEAQIYPLAVNLDDERAYLNTATV